MRVLVACEYSGRVRQAFRNRGHDAWSCDLLEAEANYTSAFHYRCDVISLLNGQSSEYGVRRWDLIIAHPPCTDLAVSGARHFPEKIADGRQQRALDFVQALMDAPCNKIALENPISIISTKIRKPDQIIQPWMFGHPETKSTCLWLKGLPKLVPNDDAEHVKAHMMTLKPQERNRVFHMTPGPNRWKERSRTYQGIADAMAEQWG